MDKLLVRETASKPKTLTSKAIALLQRVKRHILADPRRIAMSTWRSERSQAYNTDMYTWPECGTVACIGGWVEVLNGLTGARAENILGLSQPQEDELFYDEKLVEAHKQQMPAHARAVAKHIDRFIAKYRPATRRVKVRA